MTILAIAEAVNRALSTISREFAHNGWRCPSQSRGRGPPLVANGYRARGKDRREQISDPVSIHLRLPDIDDRVVQAHWAGDPIKGAGNASMTYGQGKEMAVHATFTDRTGIKVCFVDPHSRWHRGINENTNGLLRRHLPKGADLSMLSQRDLDAIVFDLNIRPRKPLGWKCPLELFMPESLEYETNIRKHVALPT